MLRCTLRPLRSLTSHNVRSSTLSVSKVARVLNAGHFQTRSFAEHVDVERRNFDIVEIKPGYPRDLYGYGPNPPDAQWPGGAKVAVSFVLNWEEGAEKSVLNGDKVSEDLGAEWALSQVYTERNPNIESMFEYGSRAGFWRILKMFDDRNMKFTNWGVTVALQRNPEATKAIFDSGHELATHGYRWYDYYGVPEDKEREHIQKIIEVQMEMTGTRPLGIGIVRQSNNSYRLAVEEGGFEYYSDHYNDDLPWWDYSLDKNKPNLIIPYTLNLNDGHFWHNRYGKGQDYYDNLVDYFDVLYEEGQNGAAKMMTVPLHNRSIGAPNRAKWLAKFLDYIQAKGDVWVPTRVEIARHWKKTHPSSTYPPKK